MRKRLLSFILVGMLGGAQYLFALSPVNLTVGYVDPTPTFPGHGKGPVTVASLWQEDHQLQFEAGHADYTLTLLDGSGTVVYAAYVPSALTTLALPTALIGTYELQLQPVGCDYYFYGYIIL